ncbi:MAG: tRNA (adenosine(37)-N6)-threonylcarbamoyltransferase complex transferase subunit TsaD [bacterium]|nr:tRNA (adenosine(37)-N6)-threonylcarbamoyltransferase complex transferase subunit TsaD [bacterium]
MNTKKTIRILAIETSCDETAAAVIGEENGQPVILSNIISSSVNLHAETGGIVPEVASREQMKYMVPVVSQALINSKHEIRNSKQIQNPNDQNSKPVSDFDIRISDFYSEAIFELQNNITHIAVTAGPGLIGSLLVGFNAAKTLAYARDLPIIPINHIEGHLYSALAEEFKISNLKFKNNDKIEKLKNEKIFPALALTVSGGHTMLVLMKNHGDYDIIGQTIDDAVGEAYDKVARLLGLNYPGGPEIAKLAEHFRNRVHSTQYSVPSQDKNPEYCELSTEDSRSPIVFPRPIINDGTFNFSFSGLKTAVLVKVKKIMAENNLQSATDINLRTKEEIAAAFEEAVADVLTFKTVKAVEKYSPRAVIFAGGVSANHYLVESLKLSLDTARDRKVKSIEPDIQFLTPPKEMSGDNAAMIGLAAYYHIQRGDVSDWSSVKVDANLKLI